MFCQKCGKEIPENVRFCPSCGAEQTTDQQGNAAGNPVVSKAGPNPKKVKGGKKTRLPVIAAAAVIVVVLTIALITALRKPTIDLNKYAQVAFSGYDGYGTAEISLDYDALYEENRKKLSNAEDSDFYADELLVFCIDASLDKTSGLSNGDTVVFGWRCDDESALETFGVKLKYSDIEFTVEGLEEAEVKDVFEGVDVVFSGISPDGSASIQFSGSEFQNILGYSLDKDSGLSNGDTVTVSVSRNYEDDVAGYLAENYGVVPEATEKTFSVSGLESYVQTLSEVDETTLEKIKAQAEDAFMSYTAREWDEVATVDGIEYAGSYLLTNKDTSRYSGAVNQLYVIMKITSSLEASDSRGEETFSADPSFYWYVMYEDLIIGNDGSVIVDINDYITTKDTFEIEAPNILVWGSPKRWIYYGYQTLDDLQYSVVTVNREAYSSEESMEQ